MCGLSVLGRWREAERHMPVLILTARGAWPYPELDVEMISQL
jgi:hypothetical protein